MPQDVVGAEIPGGAPLDYRPVRPTRSAGDPRDAEEAARLLVEAQSPVLYAGQGVMYAEATAELRELAELLAAPVMTTMEGKGAFPEDHALALGTAAIVLTGPAKHFLAASDVVLAIGASLTRHNITTATLPDGKRIIHATNDPRDLHKAYATERAILGDAKLVLRQLADAVRDRLDGKARDARPVAQEIARLRDAWLAEWRGKLGSAERPITPYRVIAEFMRAVDPAEAIVTHDSGSPRDQIVPFYRAVAPRGYIGWGKSHALGTGLGLTIGAKLAAPEKFCVNFMGDAAFGMTGLDFETAVRVGAPICTMVFNNATMAIETGHMRLSHEKYRTRDIGGNYAGIARELGGWSERVEDPGEIAGAIRRARRATEEGRAALLEFVTGPEQAFSYRRAAAG
ncbi:thiamine pyrophosphate-dependent enzyme [Caldovatus sediminis]|uniref:thiamine pyrophosphate-dependent enzyme n=1 Tax=Caldovatus sediminis TaxID=2041189 RepID=UPI001E304444|nr:thiamine pyrophosphate-dependent enzyme [Caldovatus sediminis]